MAHLAVLTFGIFHNGIENTTLPTFNDRSASIFDMAERVPGFVKMIADKSYHDEPISAFVKESDITGSSELLSLWTHLEPLFAFTYKGIHAEALHKRSQWFVKAAWPTYVLWWVDDRHAPTGMRLMNVMNICTSTALPRSRLTSSTRLTRRAISYRSIGY